MAQKNRNDITAAVATNIYDNNNKEIIAAMVRDVLADYRDSYFNLIDDQLKGFKYNSTQTLEQYLASVIGSLPISGTVTGINVGGIDSYGVSGIISSATMISASNNTDSLLEVNFSQSIANRKLVPTFIFTTGDYNGNNDVCMPVIKVISSTRINVGLRKVANVGTNLTLQIIAL